MKTRKINITPTKKSIRKSRRNQKFTKLKRAKFGGDRSKIPLIETKVLGKVPSGPKSKTLNFATPRELKEYVYDIKEGPQICSIPAGEYRHAFLVDVQPDKIMISDWGGEAVIYRSHRMINQIIDGQISLQENPNYNVNYTTYAEFLEKLQEKYNLPIIFYPVDEEMNNCSRTLHTERGGTGGCSNYIYKWTKKYYPHYKV